MYTSNALLQLMNSSDRSALIDNSETVDLPYGKRLEEPGKPPLYAYFIESGLASLMYMGRGDHVAEVALVGKEGCTGCGIILGAESSPQGIMMQVPGQARRIETSHLTRAMDESRNLHRFLLRFVHTQLVQRDETTLTASEGKIRHRLARWILMVHDRLGSDDLPLTHDVIALMLSVRRAGVTVALGELRDEGLIEMARGTIQVIDRSGLLGIAGVYYGAPEAEFERLIGTVSA